MNRSAGLRRAARARAQRVEVLARVLGDGSEDAPLDTKYRAQCAADLLIEDAKGCARARSGYSSSSARCESRRRRQRRRRAAEWGAARKPDEGYFRFRWLPYADLHFGPRWRLFGQLQGAWSSRSEELKVPFTDETGLDLLQGFAEYRFAFNPKKALSRCARAGRSSSTVRSASSPPARTSASRSTAGWCA